jgi:D-serine deaminase-like pyridoxal phosphate-dependent protein
MKITEIETPALILNEPALLRNMSAAKALTDKIGISLRPHYKSHRCAYLAQLQMSNGAKGITCAKVGEAEDLNDAGIQDILIANQVTAPSKIARAVQVALKTNLTICVDSKQNVLDLEAAASLSNARLSVYIEFEIGMNRCGVETFEEVYALADLIQKQPHLHFKGIQAYAGQLSHEYDDEKRLAHSVNIEHRLSQLKEYLESREIPVKEISGLSTGTLPLRRKMKTVYTEAQAGSYLFMDDCYGKMSLPFEHSLFVMAAVVSVRGDAFYTDAGLKTCSVDQGNPVLKDHPEVKTRLSEEHISQLLPGHTYKVNDRVLSIPGHCCTNINLFDRIYLVSGDEVLRVLPVTSRGKSQ